ncbi:protein CCC1 [Sphaerulina musiva SO2202]|uniref:Protein CCC1 n=1 Tax=Sphaerulina musiva (strain SO2202) TaxID=692275 RepID=M3C1X0_SPHMS|nr:protein CCC1 [Sphaerulina musiva SO2202]EMF14306.1 protein CCC1 [Sphaerulina musiva SO2202]
MFSKFPEQLRLPHHLLAKKKKKKEKPQDVEKATTQSTSSGHAEGHSTNGIFVRDSIIGFADGLTVPFALTAGLSSLGSSKVVILGGLAELFAGSISMGLGAYLAAKTDLKHYEVEEKRERREVKDCPAAEEEEIYDIFDQYGIPRLASAGVVESLKKDEDAWFMMDFELKLEKPLLKTAWVEGLVMGISYFFGGLFPMIPYFVTKQINEALFVSIGITVVILLAFGYVKGKATGCSVRDSAIGAVETLFIGALAAGVSYGIVKGINSSKLFDSYERP